MTKEQLYDELDFVNHSKENRKRYAHLVINDLDLLTIVMDLAFNIEDKKSYRAAWLLEFVARENLDVILPYLDRFTTEMHKVEQDAAIRPMAKICEYLIEAYYHKTPNKTKEFLKAKHKERIIELSFDYLITNQKIAPQAYSMNTLFLLGKDYDWVHPELTQILERNYSTGSAGYKARARQLLSKLKK